MHQPVSLVVQRNTVFGIKTSQKKEEKSQFEMAFVTNIAEKNECVLLGNACYGKRTALPFRMQWDI